MFFFTKVQEQERWCRMLGIGVESVLILLLIMSTSQKPLLTSGFRILNTGFRKKMLELNKAMGIEFPNDLQYASAKV
jgi:hypothetical protein